MREFSRWEIDHYDENADHADPQVRHNARRIEEIISSAEKARAWEIAREIGRFEGLDMLEKIQRSDDMMERLNDLIIGMENGFMGVWYASRGPSVYQWDVVGGKMVSDYGSFHKRLWLGEGSDVYEEGQFVGTFDLHALNRGLSVIDGWRFDPDPAHVRWNNRVFNLRAEYDGMTSGALLQISVHGRFVIDYV